MSHLGSLLVHMVVVRRSQEKRGKLQCTILFRFLLVLPLSKQVTWQILSSCGKGYRLRKGDYCGYFGQQVSFRGMAGDKGAHEDLSTYFVPGSVPSKVERLISSKSSLLCE